jgi:serine/threonine-protein kinase
MIGQILSHYRVVEKIGEGGMGEVYLARDERLDREVAIKVLPTGTLADDQARKQFHNEALALSKVNHPHIATVYEFDSHGGVDFIVMELIHGVSLAQRIEEGPLAEAAIAELGGQIAEALEEAHERGVIHRDLKPGNIAIDPKGRVKVLDFGLARVLKPVSDLSTTDKVEESPTVAGTVPYMAPEELRAERSDHRSDIYSFGVVLYEMATGRLPFDDETFTLLLTAILGRAPEPPSAVNAQVSPALETIILKALEKDPGLRYQSAGEMRVDLERLISPLSLIPPQPPAKPRSRARYWLLGGLAAALAAALTVLGLVLLGGEETPAIDSLAVLPLENLSGDPEQEFFTAGLTDALTTDLAKIGALKVISRSSTRRFQGTDKPIPEIAGLLDVDAVIVGSVARSGDRVRITAQLVHADTERSLWAESYERGLSDVLILQSELAREIAGEIQLTLTPEEEARLSSVRPVDPRAHVAYLKGRFHWDKRTKRDPQHLENGLKQFQEAIDLDPGYAAAYAGLADSFNMLAESEYGKMPDHEASEKAKAAARKALELDDDLAEGHAALGFALMKDGDQKGAERQLKRAIELNPSSSIAYHFHSIVLCRGGDIEGATAAEKRALELDPLSSNINVNLGRYLYWARRYDDAIEQLRKTLELDQSAIHANFWLGFAYLQKSMHAEAVAAHEKLGPDSPDARGYTYGVVGRREDARREIAHLLEIVPEGSYYAVAVAYLGIGDKEQAFEWLEKSAEDQETGGLLHAQHDPVFDPIRDDPRFQQLLGRLKDSD